MLPVKYADFYQYLRIHPHMSMHSSTEPVSLTRECILFFSLYHSLEPVSLTRECILFFSLYHSLEPVLLTQECILFFSLYHSLETVSFTWPYIIHLILYCTTCYQYIIKSTKSSSCTSFTDNSYMCFVQKSHYYVEPSWKDCSN